MRKGLVHIDPERCKGCFLCVKACPFAVLDTDGPLNSEGIQTARVVQVEKCTACSACYLMCPDLALQVYLLEDKAK